MHFPNQICVFVKGNFVLFQMQRAALVSIYHVYLKNFSNISVKDGNYNFGGARFED